MNDKSKILVVGGLNIDLVMDVPRIPVAGETVKGSSFIETPGGKGANQAIACSLLGGETTMLGRTGNDAFSDVLCANLQKANINTSYVKSVANNHTGVALIMVDDKGNNIISFSPGANGALSIEDIKEEIKCFSDNNTLLIQNECSFDTVAHCLKVASEAGLKVIYNPAPAVVEFEPFYKYCDVIIPNETEAEFLTGVKITDINSMKKAADYFINLGCPSVIITLGKSGAFYKNTEGSGLIPSPDVEAVDTVAAGDVFLGAFTVAYSKGNKFTSAIKIANHAASISVTKKGAQTSIPNLEVLYKIYPYLRSEK